MACRATRTSSRSPPMSPRTDGTGTRQNCEVALGLASLLDKERVLLMKLLLFMNKVLDVAEKVSCRALQR